MSFRFFSVLASSVCLVVLTVGCSSSVPKRDAGPVEVPARPSTPPPTGTPEEILQQAAKTFSSAPGLSDDQKAQLARIYIRTYIEAKEIREQIGLLKTQMFEKIAKVSYKSSEIEKLKNKIVALDQRRLALMFKSLSDVQEVVGYGKDREEIYRRLRDYDIHRAIGVTSN